MRKDMKITTRDMKGWWKDPHRTIRCSECDAEVNPKRHALGYNVCLECGEIMARDVKHCVVPLHKSNYTVITRKSDLIGINNKQPC